ncbi:MAG TPA: hypothetical protein VE258_07825, partial [Ktedonobacterales bacterium]|nr:hypothetical protein [Ktedonobacterales bacterium]
SGAGILLLLMWLAYRWGWLSPPTRDVVSLPTFFVLILLIGAGLGLFSWVGFEIGRRRQSRVRRSSGSDQRGAYLRGFALSLLLFLVLGTIYGLVFTVPVAIGRPLSSESDMALFTVVGYVVIVGSPALVPLVNGLLTGARATPNALRAFLGGLTLGVCGGMAFLLPLILLIRLLVIPPSCAQTEPPTCSFLYFGPTFWMKVLSFLVACVALLVGFCSGVAAGLGVLGARLTERRWASVLQRGSLPPPSGSGGAP